ncbi:hypothetical protein P245_22840 [Comamonas thiooxydans]|uniref:Uncharacterized protein n=2 Tax=Comamonadaceae TaxID=80864 RepID=A0A0E3B9U1_9BURK|nr:hypothetical protein P245_22840 [Comamonas thiooxydans]
MQVVAQLSRLGVVHHNGRQGRESGYLLCAT